MVLTVLDRILLLNILPTEGDIFSLRIVRKLREDLSFSEQEHVTLRLKQEGAQVQWDTEAAAAADKEVAIGPKAHALIAETLTKLSEAKQLGMQYVSLYDKFIPTE